MHHRFPCIGWHVCFAKIKHTVLLSIQFFAVKSMDDKRGSYIKLIFVLDASGRDTLPKNVQHHSNLFAWREKRSVDPVKEASSPKGGQVNQEVRKVLPHALIQHASTTLTICQSSSIICITPSKGNSYICTARHSEWFNIYFGRSGQRVQYSRSWAQWLP